MKKFLLVSSLLLSLTGCYYKASPYHNNDSQYNDWANATQSCSVYFDRLENNKISDNKELDRLCLNMTENYNYNQAEVDVLIENGNPNIWRYFLLRWYDQL